MDSIRPREVPFKASNEPIEMKIHYDTRHITQRLVLHKRPLLKSAYVQDSDSV